MIKLFFYATLVGALGLPLGYEPALAQTRADAAGTIVQSVAQGGTLGRDFSANAPTLPTIGANFGATGVYANYVLIATVPASATRFNIDVENVSGAQIVVIRDDGTASNGASPVNASVFALAPGSAAGAQGGSYASQTFKGRLQIFAPSASAQVAIFAD
jgi:hypothetical protein